MDAFAAIPSKVLRNTLCGVSTQLYPFIIKMIDVIQLVAFTFPREAGAAFSYGSSLSNVR